MSASTEPQLLTTQEAAARLGLRKRTFLRRVESGMIPFARKLHEPNGAYLFHPDVIAAQAKASA